MDDKVRQLAAEVAAGAPPGWERIDAVFSLTVLDAAVDVVDTVDGDLLRREPSDAALRLAYEQRELVAEQGREPWWRLVLTLAPDHEPRVEFDDGAEPFDGVDLLSPHAYRSDVARYPRRRLPLWLAAYAFHDGWQSRSADKAARAARADELDGIRPVLAINDFPPLPAMWARWATLAAIFAGTGSELGPRILPSVGWFEGVASSGSTLFLLPGGRAVLSGGLWDDRPLADGYLGAAPMPDYYRGAPFWVANPVLNERADDGTLTFCYWWDGGCWYRGDSPPPAHFAPAVPGILGADMVVGLAAAHLDRRDDAEFATAAKLLLDAAERAEVTRVVLARAVGADLEFDLDAAWYQFFVAGLTVSETPEVTAERAKDLVRQYFADSGLDRTGYPLADLVTERIENGWLVYAPSPRGEFIIGRTLFYVADDGVVERSSSSADPAAYAKAFARRYRSRRRA